MAGRVPRAEQRPRWLEFLKAHWESPAAIDFFTHEVYTFSGLPRYIRVSAVHLCGPERTRDRWRRQVGVVMRRCSATGESG